MPGGGLVMRCGQEECWDLGLGATGLFFFSLLGLPQLMTYVCVDLPGLRVYIFSQSGHELTWVLRGWPLLLLSVVLPSSAAAQKGSLPERAGQVGSRLQSTLILRDSLVILLD